MHAFTNQHFHASRYYNICSGAELNQPKSFATIDLFPVVLPADDSSREDPCDLLANDGYFVAFDRECVLFIYQAGALICGYQEFSFSVRDICYAARDRRTINVNV